MLGGGGWAGWWNGCELWSNDKTDRLFCSRCYCIGSCYRSSLFFFFISVAATECAQCTMNCILICFNYIWTLVATSCMRIKNNITASLYALRKYRSFGTYIPTMHYLTEIQIQCTYWWVKIAAYYIEMLYVDTLFYQYN